MFKFKQLPVLAALVAMPLSVASADLPAEDSFVLLGGDNPFTQLTPEQKPVHPVTSPFYHEDSFVTSDVRTWAIYHDFPNSSLIDGGKVKAYAAQLRIALTESVQLVAYKDGYYDFETGLVDESGWNDIAAGLKWAFIQDWDNEFHAAVGAGYEIGAGDDEVLQDDEELRIWASVNKGIDGLHLGATVNYLIATDSEDALGDSDRVLWHLHADYFVCDLFSPVVEVNGYYTASEGDNTPLPFNGVDVANLGGGKDEHVITAGVGGEFRLAENLAARVAYEFPLTNNDDLFGYRWTGSVVFGF